MSSFDASSSFLLEFSLLTGVMVLGVAVLAVCYSLGNMHVGSFARMTGTGQTQGFLLYHGLFYEILFSKSFLEPITFQRRGRKKRGNARVITWEREDQSGTSTHSLYQSNLHTTEPTLKLHTTSAPSRTATHPHRHNPPRIVTLQVPCCSSLQRTRFLLCSSTFTGFRVSEQPYHSVFRFCSCLRILSFTGKAGRGTSSSTGGATCWSWS